MIEVEIGDQVPHLDYQRSKISSQIANCWIYKIADLVELHFEKCIPFRGTPETHSILHREKRFGNRSIDNGADQRSISSFRCPSYALNPGRTTSSRSCTWSVITVFMVTVVLLDTVVARSVPSLALAYPNKRPISRREFAFVAGIDTPSLSLLAVLEVQPSGKRAHSSGGSHSGCKGEGR